MSKVIPEVEKNMAIDGDRPMSIVRRMARERERCLGMTDEERAWRLKWLKAQELAPEEPVVPKEYYKEMYNPIRRFYMAPMNKFQNMLAPIMGTTGAFVMRHTIAKFTLTMAGIYWAYYNLKYNRMDWTKKGGWKITLSRPMIYPDTKDREPLYRVKGNQFHVNNFDKSSI